MTVAGWKAAFARLPDELEVAMGDTDPMSDGFVLAEPYEPVPVRVVGQGLQTCVVVGMSFRRARGPIIRPAGARSKSFRERRQQRGDSTFDEGDMPGEGF